MKQRPCVAVAYSGGRDSTALLHATVAAARAQALEVVALHVHHGLQAAADEWLRHCAATCRRWAARGAPLRFDFVRLTTKPLSGESVEAWARRERYRALAGMARTQGASAVLLAHHRRDQAETFLLQALRGGGVAGLAAMPREIERDGVRWLRPWLATSRAEIEAYARQHRLRHIEDPSNGDPRFARSRLRTQAWPALSDAFPEAEAALAASAQWAQQASALMAEIASEDLTSLAAPDGLLLREWRDLSPARRVNALRTWLAAQTGAAAASSLVQRLMVELDRAGTARWPIAGGELRRYRGRLRFEPLPPAAALPVVAHTLSIRRAGSYRMPGWPGRLQVVRVEREGVALARLTTLRVVGRSGGESFQLGPDRPARALKKQYQALGIAAWERDGPLLYAGGELVFAAGLGVDARAWAEAGEPQVTLRWLKDDQPTVPG